MRATKYHMNDLLKFCVIYNYSVQNVDNVRFRIRQNSENWSDDIPFCQVNNCIKNE